MTISANAQSKTGAANDARDRWPGARRLRAIGFLVLGTAMATFCGTPALAWGVEGHAVVADIAQAHLTEPARRQVRALLDADGKTSLDQISSWADMVRMQRRGTGPWHYVDIPLEADRYDPARDCPGGECVVAKIEDFEKILAASKSVTPDRVEALKWVVHFVGDIHQPLHAEDHDDKGGNEVPVAGFGKRANLHSIWDTDFIEQDDPDASDAQQPRKVSGHSRMNVGGQVSGYNRRRLAQALPSSRNWQPLGTILSAKRIARRRAKTAY